MSNSLTNESGPRRHRAQERLADWQRVHPWRPDYFRAVDKMRAAHAKDWPRYTFLPVSDAGLIIARAWRKHNCVPAPGHTAGDVLAPEASAFAGFASWRVTQGIYRFDPTLGAALADTPLTGDLPVSALTHLPHWCVYIETPGQTMRRVMGGAATLYGFYAWIDGRRPEDTPTLMLGLDADRPYPTLPVSLVRLGGTLQESLRASEASLRESYEAGLLTNAPQPGHFDNGEALAPLISLLLYLCADEAEIGDGLVRPQQPKPTKTKQGWRVFPPQAPNVWDVGPTNRRRSSTSPSARRERGSRRRRAGATSSTYSSRSLGDVLDRSAVV